MNTKNAEPPKLVSIKNVVADIQLTERGASALCPDGSLVPLMRNDGPVAVSVECGHIQFGDVRPLNQLREGQVMLVYKDSHLFFWTFLTWVHKAQELIEIRHDELARIAEQKQRKQEISRRNGLRQRQQVLTPNFRKTEDGGGLDPQGRRVLNQAHEQASRFGLPLSEVLDRELAIA